MGTIIVLILILLLIIYPPYMLIKWAIYGRGLFFPDFNKIAKKVKESAPGWPINLTGGWGKVNYYFVFLWTLGEIVFLIFLLIIYHQSLLQ